MPDFTDYFTPESDVAYTGLEDTASGFSGGSALDDPWLGSPVNMGGLDDSSFWSTTFDFINGEDPYAALNLTGVSDPPFASSTKSTPYPGATDTGPSTWAALGALGKLGNTVASLFGNHPQTVRPAAYPPSSIATGQQPTGAVSGTSTVMVLIIAGALILLLLRMED